MICFDSGSDFKENFFSPFPVSFPAPVPNPDIIKQIFPKTKI
jgi:hypothetical protein